MKRTALYSFVLFTAALLLLPATTFASAQEQDSSPSQSDTTCLAEPVNQLYLAAYAQDAPGSSAWIFHHLVSQSQAEICGSFNGLNRRMIDRLAVGLFHQTGNLALTICALEVTGECVNQRRGR